MPDSLPATSSIGTAGWTIPRAVRDRFPESGSSLARYAARFTAAEINSSFHRPHRPAIYERWAASTPPDFRFAVKVPKTITHVRRLADVGDELDRFLGESAALGAKRRVLLVQLPPSAALEPPIATRFFEELRGRFDGEIACEPRHASWFAPEAGAMLAAAGVARVAADPARVPGAGEPGGWMGLVYYRLHGAPRTYYSAYEPPRLDDLARRLLESEVRGVPAWCIFDNTASGAATGDALGVLDRIAAATTR
ncbi:MAG: DUF72 domain-containing protein [Gemmatimonadaceae bacterium]